MLRDFKEILPFSSKGYLEVITADTDITSSSHFLQDEMTLEHHSCSRVPQEVTYIFAKLVLVLSFRFLLRDLPQ